jgi:hypothetical protein
MTLLIPLRVRLARFQMPRLRTPNLPACVFAVRATAVLATLAAVLMAPLVVRAAEPPSCPGCAATPVLPTADIVPDLPAKPPAPPNDPAVQARMPGCAIWTDRCVTCTRAAGAASCSNIGIACQPQAVECLMTEEDAKKQEGGKAEKQDDKAEKKREN